MAGYSSSHPRKLFFHIHSGIVGSLPIRSYFGSIKVQGDQLYYSLLQDEGWVEKAKLIYKVGEEGESLFSRSENRTPERQMDGRRPYAYWL